VTRTEIIVADITTLEVDAIVNAANEQLLRGGGVCGAIFRAAGPELDAACRAVAPCATGDARITPGFRAKAKWIVHAVGPVWHGGNRVEAELLASAYTQSLRLAAEAGARSIAFPAISTGIFGYPRDRAAAVAKHAAHAWCVEHELPERIIFCCFSEDDAEFYSLE
jgi:O-acetyl-ADP-ribose deacetylase (regulator of RNase III)